MSTRTSQSWVWFAAMAALVAAVLLPGVHGLSIGGLGCGESGCADKACAPVRMESRIPRKAGCSCGHEHEAEPELAAAVREEDGAPEGDPSHEPREPHDHGNCPICKLIFAGSHRFAAAEHADVAIRSTEIAVRVALPPAQVRESDVEGRARPRAPPALRA